MTESHAFGETKSVRRVFGLLPLDGSTLVRVTSGLLLSPLLIKSNFGQDSGSELNQHVGDALFDVVSGLLGESLDLL